MEGSPALSKCVLPGGEDVRSVENRLGLRDRSSNRWATGYLSLGDLQGPRSPREHPESNK